MRLTRIDAHSGIVRASRVTSTKFSKKKCWFSGLLRQRIHAYVSSAQHYRQTISVDRRRAAAAAVEKIVF